MSVSVTSYKIRLDVADSGVIVTTILVVLNQITGLSGIDVVCVNSA